jgi:WD40 repeat protein
MATPPGKALGSYSLALSPNGRYLAMGAENGYITVLDMTKPNATFIEKLIHSGPVRSLAWSPDNMLLASGGLDKTIQVMDITTKAIAYILPLARVVNDLSWEPGSTGRIAIASSNDTVVIWNIHTDERTPHTGHQGLVTAVAWGPQALASGSTDKAIIIWNV